MVIQQGRLAEAKKTLGKDEMLDMIRHGADQVMMIKLWQGECSKLCIYLMIRSETYKKVH